MGRTESGSQREPSILDLVGLEIQTPIRVRYTGSEQTFVKTVERTAAIQNELATPQVNRRPVKADQAIIGGLNPPAIHDICRGNEYGRTFLILKKTVNARQIG